MSGLLHDVIWIKVAGAEHRALANGFFLRVYQAFRCWVWQCEDPFGVKEEGEAGDVATAMQEAVRNAIRRTPGGLTVERSENVITIKFDVKGKE